MAKGYAKSQSKPSSARSSVDFAERRSPAMPFECPHKKIGPFLAGRQDLEPLLSCVGDSFGHGSFLDRMILLEYSGENLIFVVLSWKASGPDLREGIDADIDLTNIHKVLPDRRESEFPPINPRSQEFDFSR